MTFDRDTHETPVIFRKFGKSEGEAIIALFPAEPYATSGYDCSSYMHVGQHGGASPDLIHHTKPASPAEYADLAHELKGLGYRLKVCRRYSKHHRETLRAEQRRLRST